MNTATVAVEQKEETMKVLSIAELLCLTRGELLELQRSLELQLEELDYDSSEFRDSMRTLGNVRQVLLRRVPSAPRPAPS